MRPEMTRVDFYILADPAPEALLRTACRIVEKAWHGGHSVFAHTASEAAAQQLDEWLWSWRQESFVPHGLYSGGDGAQFPVLIACGAEPPETAEVLVNLTDEVPEFCVRFPRIAELVGGGAQFRAAGRARYRRYRELGCILHTHDL